MFYSGVLLWSFLELDLIACWNQKKNKICYSIIEFLEAFSHFYWFSSLRFVIE